MTDSLDSSGDLEDKSAGSLYFEDTEEDAVGFSIGWIRGCVRKRDWQLSIDSMMQMTGQNLFTRSLSCSYKMTNECKSEMQMPWLQWNSQSMSVSRMANGDGKWFNHFYEKQCHVWCVYSPFHISSALLIGYLQVITLPLHACSTSPLVISPC